MSGNAREGLEVVPHRTDRLRFRECNELLLRRISTGNMVFGMQHCGPDHNYVVGIQAYQANTRQTMILRVAFPFPTYPSMFLQIVGGGVD